MFTDYDLSDLELEMTLESASIEIDDAMEGLFKAKKTAVADLLAAKEKKLCKKLKTEEACNDALAKANEAEKNFKDCVTKIVALGKQLNAGKIDEKTFKKQAAPITKMLKAFCKNLNVALGNFVDDSKAPTQEEIKEFASYVKGYKAIILKCKAAAKAAPAKEAFLDDIFSDSFALESFDGCEFDSFDFTLEGDIEDDDDDAISLIESLEEEDDDEDIFEESAIDFELESVMLGFDF